MKADELLREFDHEVNWSIPKGYEATFAVRCPDCSAKPEAPCTYFHPKDAHGNPVVPFHSMSKATLAAIEKAGKPTKRPHAGRMRLATSKERARHKAPARTEDLYRQAILVANADAVKAEHTALREWLIKHGRILL